MKTTSQENGKEGTRLRKETNQATRESIREMAGETAVTRGLERKWEVNQN